MYQITELGSVLGPESLCDVIYSETRCDTTDPIHSEKIL